MTATKEKLEYERPVVEKVETMEFPIEIIMAGRRVVCRQCSACHACRGR